MTSIFKLVRNKIYSNDGYYCKANVKDKYGYMKLSFVGPVFDFDESIVEEIKKYKTLNDFYYSNYGYLIRKAMSSCIYSKLENCNVTEFSLLPPPPPPEIIEVIEDEEEIEETVIESTETDQEEEIEIDDVEIEEVEEDVDVPFFLVESAPIFKGCERAKDKKKCMSEKIAEFVKTKFNTDLASDLGLTGRQRISVIFKIDKRGNVVRVRTRAPHPRLAKEAERVINLLPKMQPGKQRGVPVNVTYSLPIIFQVP